MAARKKAEKEAEALRKKQEKEEILVKKREEKEAEQKKKQEIEEKVMKLLLCCVDCTGESSQGQTTNYDASFCG